MNDSKTSPPQIDNEFDRLIELSEMDIDYTEIKDYLSDLNKLAARIANTSISFVNLIDSYTQWTVSYEGLDIEQMPREESVCQFTITQEKEFEVNDLSEDERFKDKFYVKDDPSLKYYFGIPLTSSEGNNIGALCVMDKNSKDLDPEKKELLRLIADEVVKRLEFLKEHKSLKQKLDEIKENHRKVGHDIRGPLGGIIGLAEIVQKELGEDQSEDIIKMLTLIKKGGQSVLDLAEEIMEQANDNKEPDSDEFSTQTFIEKLEQLYEPQAKSKGVELEFIDNSANKLVFFPKTKLKQIAGNLISNSIKFTPADGKVTITVDIKNLNSEEQKLSIAVKDTGVGITEEKKYEILSDKQSSETGTKGEKGYGFGLSLVKHLINKADGTLEIRSEPGEGSVVYVELPI